MRRFLPLALALVVPACADETEPPLSPLEATPRFAVRSSDFSSSSIGLLDANADPLVTSWLSSGSTAPGLVTTISGDNTFPLVAEPGVLTILDRFGSDVMTRIALPSGMVLGQVRTHDAALANGFTSNPYDFVRVSANRGFVTRYGVNVDEGAPDAVKGNDLWGIDPSTMMPNGERIDLSIANATMEVTTDAGPKVVPVYARPNRALVVGDYLVVGLDRITESFEDAAAGRVAVVSLANLANVQLVDMGDLVNCGFLLKVPGSPNRFGVRCIGYRKDARAESGVVVFELGDGGTVTEVDAWLAAEHPNDPNLVGNVVMLSSTRFVGVALGGYEDPTDPDGVYDVDLAADTHTKLFDTTAGYDVFGTMAFDPTTGLVLVPDRTSGIHRLRFANQALGHLDVFRFGRRGLPVVDITVLP